MRLTNLVLAVATPILLTLAACSTRPEPNGFMAIEISEDACFGTCPIYSIRVTPDDHYVLDGERFTRSSGRSEGQLAAGAFGALAGIIRDADVMAFPADITPSNPAACGSRIATDLPGFNIRVVLRERDKDVHWYPGCQASSYGEEMTRIRAAMREAINHPGLIAPKR